MEKKRTGAMAFGPVRSWVDTLAGMPEWLYLLLLGVYIATYLISKIRWTSNIAETVMLFRIEVQNMVVWAGAFYMFFVFVSWGRLEKKPPLLVLAAAITVGLAGWLRYGMSEESYTLVMDVFFCLTAIGKDYKRILKCVMWMAFAALFLALIGLVLGFTQERLKTGPEELVTPGHSFGIIYPNTWGYIAFLGLLPLWYLYLRKKKVITFAVFWGTTLFMFFVVSCRTVSLLTLVFPLLTLAAEWLEDRHEDKGLPMKIGNWVLMLAPFLAYAFTMLMAWNMEWVHGAFYNTPLLSFAMRFVQAGIALTYNGLPLFGHPLVGDANAYVILNGQQEFLTVMDNAYITYTIIRGLLWMALALCWLFAAHRKCLKRHDYRLLLLSCILLVFAMMERPGLNVWFNYILLYPLATVALPDGEAVADAR